MGQPGCRREVRRWWRVANLHLHPPARRVLDGHGGADLLLHLGAHVLRHVRALLLLHWNGHVLSDVGAFCNRSCLAAFHILCVAHLVCLGFANFFRHFLAILSGNSLTLHLHSVSANLLWDVSTFLLGDVLTLL